MSEEKDGLKSIEVYKFNNIKEGWHECALKFRVIADNRGYDDIIEGKEAAPDEKKRLGDPRGRPHTSQNVQKRKTVSKTYKQKKFRDLVVSTEGFVRSTLLKTQFRTS